MKDPRLLAAFNDAYNAWAQRYAPHLLQERLPIGEPCGALTQRTRDDPLHGQSVPHLRLIQGGRT